METNWKRFRLVLTWGYLVELLAAALICALIWVIATLYGANTADVVDFMGKTADSWATLTGVLFAAALGFWASYLSVIAGPFGEYLEEKKVTNVYSTALLAAGAVYFVATVLLIVANGIDATGIRLAALCAVIYSLINAVTMVKTASEIVMNHAAFKTIFATELQNIARSSNQPTNRDNPVRSRGKQGRDAP